jgi:hypothetical protein
MSQPEVPCSCCGGKGHRKLTKKLADSFRAAIDLTNRAKNFTATELGMKVGCKPDVAHHRIQRMIELKVIKRVPKVTPARYVVG